MKLRLATIFVLLTTSFGFAQGGPKIRVSSFAEVAPLLIAGGEWTTQIVFTSYRTAAVTIPLSFFGQDGKPLTIPLVGMSAASKIDVTIQPQGTVVIETERPLESLVGWVLTDIPCSGSGD